MVTGSYGWGKYAFSSVIVAFNTAELFISDTHVVPRSLEKAIAYSVSQCNVQQEVTEYHSPCEAQRSHSDHQPTLASTTMKDVTSGKLQKKGK